MTQAAGARQLWIPQSYTALRWDKTPFPAETTLSRFENRGQVFHTLILRNVDERLAAGRPIHSLTMQAGYLQAEIRALHNFDEIAPSADLLREHALRGCFPIDSVREVNAAIDPATAE